MENDEAMSKVLDELIASAASTTDDVHERLAVLHTLNEAATALEGDRRFPPRMIEDFKIHVAALIGFDSDFGRTREQTRLLAKHAATAIMARMSAGQNKARSG